METLTKRFKSCLDGYIKYTSDYDEEKKGILEEMNIAEVLGLYLAYLNIDFANNPENNGMEIDFNVLIISVINYKSFLRTRLGSIFPEEIFDASIKLAEDIKFYFEENQL
jgi:hypothetical protein